MRKILNSLASLTLIALCVSVFSNIAVTQAAFGTSPPWIKNDVILPGSTLTEVINLSRSDASKAMKIKLRMDGDEELLKWIDIQDADNLIMHEGQAILPMTVVIDVPQDAALKSYKGGIYVTLAPIAPDSTKGGEVAITLGAHISVDITVIKDEITDYQVKSASVKTQEDSEPFAVNVTVKNTGNTDIDDVEGEIQVYDKSNSEVVKTLAFVPLEEPVTFNETKEVEMIFPDYKPEPGDYWVDVKASKNGEMIYEDRLPQKVETEIIPVITPEDVLVSAMTPEQEKKSIYLMASLTGLGLVLLIVAGILAMPLIRKKKRRKKEVF